MGREEHVKNGWKQGVVEELRKQYSYWVGGMQEITGYNN